MAATDALCRSFLDLWWHFDPSTATAGRLGDFSAEGIRQHVAALRSLAGAIEELEVEDLADEVDRTALLDHVRVLLFRFEHEHPYRTNPLVWTDHIVASFTVTEPVDDPALRAAAATERLRDLPRFCRTAGETIRKPARVLLDAAREQLELAARQVRSAAALPGVPGPIAAEAAAALAELRAALEEQVLTDSDLHAGSIGEAEADRRLHYEHASIHNAGEVWCRTLRLAAEVEQEVVALAAALGPDRPWQEVYHGLAGAPLEPAEVNRFAADAALLQRFADHHQLGTGALTPLLIAAIPERAAISNRWVTYERTGRGQAVIGLGQVPSGALPWIAAGFAEPGLHRLMCAADGLPGLVRRHIAASSTTGGWCLYARRLVAELGFRPEPGLELIERVLFLRDVHLALVDVGLHTRQLSPDEAVGHLSMRIPFDRALGLADVRRMLCRPLDAAAALLGYEELEKLREDYRSARAGAFSLAGFHEELWQYGALPIPLIRWGMGLDG